MVAEKKFQIENLWRKITSKHHWCGDINGKLGLGCQQRPPHTIIASAIVKMGDGGSTGQVEA